MGSAGPDDSARGRRLGYAVVGMSGADAPTIQVNGEERPLERPLALDRLLEALGHDPRAVAVELNGDIVRRGRLPATEIRPGDRLEIVRFVQGG